MAIKKRTPVDPQKEAAIDAFGDAAEPLSQPQRSPQPSPRETAAPRITSTTTDAATEKMAKTLLIRYSDDELPLLLAEVARDIDRSQHATAIRALRRGLEVMKSDED